MARRGGNLGRSVLDLDVDDSKFNAGLARNERKAKSWTASMGRDVKRGLGQGLGIAGGLGVAAAVTTAIQGVQQVVAGSIHAAMEWESAFAGVRKTVDASEAEFADLEKSLRGMSTEIPVAATELAGLAEAAGALGIAKEDILEFTRVTALIGTTTDVSADQAATSLGQLSNVLGLASADYEKFGSTLVDLGNKGASTESQILEIASRAGAGSKLIGMATDETLAWASSVANLGIEVEAGGSALQKFFLDTAKAVSTGGPKLETYARVAGMTGAAFKKAFEEDASGALQTFLAGLGRLSQGEQLKVLADLDFNDVRITRTLLGLAGNVDNLGSSLTVANEAWEENNALAKEAAKRFDTTESKMNVLGNRVNDLAITFGNDLLPVLVDVATFGVEQIELFIKELMHFVDSVADTARWVGVHFGDIGKVIEDRANEIGVDVVEMKDAYVFAVNQMGLEGKEALEWAERSVLGLNHAMGDAAMASLEAFRAVEHGMPAATEAGVEGAEAALLAGEGPIGTAADGTFGEVDEAAEEARKAALDAMNAMLKGISGMFESDESVREAFQALLDRMDDPYTEAERKADIFSQDMLTVIRTALDSDDPGAVGAATELVNRLLGEFALMEPGALESGTAVPPGIRAGMDAQMAALIAYIETNVTGESLAAMELDAVPEGLEAIASYARGMAANKAKAKAEADAAALVVQRALEAIIPDLASAGRSGGKGFVVGVDRRHQRGHVAAAVGRGGRRPGAARRDARLGAEEPDLPAARHH